MFNQVYDGKSNNRDAVRSVAAAPDYARIRSWIMECEKDHRQCRSRGHAEQLKIITVIDVRRNCLVRYKPGMQ